MFTLNVPHYDLRDDQKIKMYSYKTKRYGYKSVLYAGAKLWNSIPVHVKSCESVSDFKSKLKYWKCKTVDCRNCLNFIYHK